MRAEDGRRGRELPRRRRRPPLLLSPRAHRGSLGATAIEYGLLVAAICAGICLALGVGLRAGAFDKFNCLMEQFQGTATADPNCVDSNGTNGGGGGGGSGGGGGGGGLPSPSPSVTPTPTP